MPRRRIPKFENEQQEALWWDRNRKELDKDFADAAKKGQLKRMDRSALRTRVAGTTKVISLRMLEEDLALAREQASTKGLPYQTFLKSLLHEALRRGE
ncbi:MAG: hypothetical protein ABI693_32065 [Bryobacteraceae bacterium]